MVDERLERLRKTAMALPLLPGVYLMHDNKDEIIYVGKAISLKNRVRQYFQSSRNKSSKIFLLFHSFADPNADCKVFDKP